MVFFDASPDSSGTSSFRVSPSWWLYFAVTIPLTALVFAVWIVWQKYREIYGNTILEEILTPGGNRLEKSPEFLTGRHKNMPTLVHVIGHHSPSSVNEPIGLDAKSIGTSRSWFRDSFFCASKVCTSVFGNHKVCFKLPWLNSAKADILLCALVNKNPM